MMDPMELYWSRVVVMGIGYVPVIGDPQLLNIQIVLAGADGSQGVKVEIQLPPDMGKQLSLGQAFELTLTEHRK
jgi:hypothetical protein